MFTLADVVHFLTNQFTRLCAGVRRYEHARHCLKLQLTVS